MRDLLDGELHGWPGGTVPGSGWPERLRPAIGLPGFAAELRELLLRAAERGLGPDELQALGRAARRAGVGRGRPLLPHLRAGGAAARGRGPGRAAGHRPGAGRRRAGRRRAGRAGQRSRAARGRACPGPAPPGRRRAGPRPAADGAGAGAGPHRPHRRCSRATRTRPCSASAARTRRASTPSTPRRRAHVSTIVPAPAIRAAGARLAARLPGRRARAHAGRPGATTRVDEADGQVAGARVRLGGAGGGLDRGRAAARAPAARRALVADGGAVALRPAHAARAAPRAARRRRADRRAAGRAAAGPPARGRAAAHGAAVRGPAGRPRRRRRHGAAHLAAGLGGPDAPAPPAPRPAAPARGRAGRTRGAGSARGAATPTDDRRAAGRGRTTGRPRPTRSASAATRCWSRRCAPPPAGSRTRWPRCPPFETAPLRRVGALLAVAGAAIREGAGAEQVLWRIWQATTSSNGGSDASALGGPVGAAADRDLDAVLALFDSAARHADRLPGADVLGVRGVPRRPAAAGRHPRRPGSRRRRGRAADGARRPRPGVAGRGRARRPGGHLAGPAAAGQPARQRAAGRRRRRGRRARRRGVAHRPAARRGAAAVLRRVHPRAGDAAGQRGAGGQRVADGDEQPSRFLDELDPVPGRRARPRGPPRAPARPRPRARGAGR